MHQYKHQMINHFKISHEQQQQQQTPLQRRYRSLFKFFDNTNHHKEYKTGDHSPVVVNEGQNPATATTKNVLQQLGHQTNRVIEGAADAVLTPFQWLSHLVRYWPLYLLCITIIFGLIAFFYCSHKSKASHLLPQPNYDPISLINLFRQQYSITLPQREIDSK